jgi:hypothetical protein
MCACFSPVLLPPPHTPSSQLRNFFSSSITSLTTPTPASSRLFLPPPSTSQPKTSLVLLAPISSSPSRQTARTARRCSSTQEMQARASASRRTRQRLGLRFLRRERRRRFASLTSSTFSSTLTLASQEFWYANVLDRWEDFWPDSGLTGKGPFREVQVLIDGVIGEPSSISSSLTSELILLYAAGLVFPFPVIYTGGANPLLHRPLASLRAFDIPSFFVDVSPFIPSYVFLPSPYCSTAALTNAHLLLQPHRWPSSQLLLCRTRSRQRQQRQ